MLNNVGRTSVVLAVYCIVLGVWYFWAKHNFEAMCEAHQGKALQVANIYACVRENPDKSFRLMAHWQMEKCTPGCLWPRD